jgi:hypothetical protein
MQLIKIIAAWFLIVALFGFCVGLTVTADLETPSVQVRK